MECSLPHSRWVLFMACGPGCSTLSSTQTLFTYLLVSIGMYKGKCLEPSELFYRSWKKEMEKGLEVLLQGSLSAQKGIYKIGEKYHYLISSKLRLIAVGGT